MITANWFISLPLWVMAGVCLLWGSNLIISGLASDRGRVTRPQRRLRWFERVIFDTPLRRAPLISGSFYLGQFLMTISIFLFGTLAFFLIEEPTESVPAWFAFPMLYAAVQCILAYWFLRPTQAEGGSDTNV